MAQGQHSFEQRLIVRQKQVNTVAYKSCVALCANTCPLLGHMASHLADKPCAYALSGSDMRPPT